MSLTRPILLPVPLLVLVASAAGAQPVSEATSAGAAKPAGMALARFLDKQTGRIMAADTDGDGRVSRAEMAAATKGGRDPSHRFDSMDANHDGYLDKAEIQAAFTRRFRLMDGNGDGVITSEERMARHKHHEKADPDDMDTAPQP